MRITTLPNRCFYLGLLVFIYLYAIPVNAQVVADNLADTSLGRFETRFDLIGNLLVNTMLNTFYLLAVIEFTWAMIKAYINQSGLQKIMIVLIERILFISFFLWLLRRGGQTATDIFRSFEDLAIATTTTTGVITPSNIIDHGQVLWARLYDKAVSIGVFDIVFDSSKSVSTPVLLIFIGILVIVIMTVMSAHFAVVLLETFIAAGAGIILLALGSSRWTYKYATGYLRYAMAAGMKLFIFSIIVGLTISEIDRFFADAAIDDINNLMALLAFISFATVITFIVPKSVKSMMDGVNK